MTWVLLCLMLVALNATTAVLWRRGERSWQRRLAAERSRTEAAVETQGRITNECEAQQRAMFERMAEGVLLVDRHGRITMANQASLKLLRISADPHGKTILEIFRIPRLADMATKLARQEETRNAELELPGVDPQLIEVSASAVVDAAGHYDGGIFVFHDLTRIKQLENTRREFVANVSHELRTPLSLIKGFVETLLDGAKDDPGETERFLRTIQKHADRLTYLIEDLLTISHLESTPNALQSRTVSLHERVRHVFDELEGKAAAQGTRLENQLPPELEAQADPERLHQVLFNLVENGIKYGRSGGRVTVSAQTEGEAQATIAVADDGPGIPKASQARIFERFFRVDRARSRETGGTGLGLSIVKHIVLAHGGTLWVESEPGKGATFFFTLPRSSPVPLPLQSQSADSPSVAAEALRRE